MLIYKMDPNRPIGVRRLEWTDGGDTEEIKHRPHIGDRMETQLYFRTTPGYQVLTRIYRETVRWMWC